MKRLEGKSCVVTGGGSGIGRATALRMAAEGASVAVCDVNDEAGAALIAQLEQLGARAMYRHCDISDSAQVQDLMAAVVAEHGGIDVLHNNAGVHESAFTDKTLLEQLPEEIFDRVCDINIKGVWLCTKHAAPHLRASKAGAVVNAASVNSFVGFANAGTYCATKGAVAMLTKAFAVELADGGVRVNAYAPAAIRTKMWDDYIEAAQDPAAAERTTRATYLVPRLGEPEDVAGLVCFLASDDASFINGATYLIDGGSLAWRGVHQ